MPQYRMQTLLEMRERAEEDAKQAFSEAMQAFVKAQQEQKRLRRIWSGASASGSSGWMSM